MTAAEMAAPESLRSAAAHREEQIITDLQLRLFQLANEQNALLQQVLTIKAANGDDRAESAAAQEPKRSCWDSLGAFLSCQPPGKLHSQIYSILEGMNRRLVYWDRRIAWLDESPESARHRKQVIKQLASLRRAPDSLRPESSASHSSPGWRGANYKYTHARATDGGKSIVGTVWTIEIRIGQLAFNSSPGDGSISARALMECDAAVAVVSLLLAAINVESLIYREEKFFSRFLLTYIMDTNFRDSLRPGPGFIEKIRHANFLSSESKGPGSDDTLLCTLHLRSFTNFPEEFEESERDASVPSISLHRYLVGDRNIQEFRRSLGLLQSVRWGDPTLDLNGNYVIVRLIDRGEFLFEKHEELPGRLKMCEPGTGIAMFQRVIWTEVDNWTKDWLGALELLEQTFAFPVSDIVDPKSRKALVYDDDKLYFKSNQLLRLFDDWIDELQPNLQRLRKEIDEMTAAGLGQEAYRIVDINWMALLDHAKASCDGLRTRIKRKRNEIQILQDGLYNTIQVREATKGTKMNQIILLFTVATILYLPPTFIATFMALDLFQTSDQSEFWHIFGTVAAATYIAAGLGLLAIYRREIIYPLASHWILKPTWIQEGIVCVQNYFKRKPQLYIQGGSNSYISIPEAGATNAETSRRPAGNPSSHTPSSTNSADPGEGGRGFITGEDLAASQEQVQDLEGQRASAGTPASRPPSDVP